jgi:hypothetical protein
MNANQIKATDVILNVIEDNAYIGPIYDNDTNEHIGAFYIMYDSNKNAFIISYNSSENTLSVLELFKNRTICEVEKDVIKKSYTATINVLNLRLSDLISTFKKLEKEWESLH